MWHSTLLPAVIDFINLPKATPPSGTCHASIVTASCREDQTGLPEHSGLRPARVHLIELMLALAILGVLGVLASASYRRYIEKTRVHHAAVEIASLKIAIK